MQVCFLMNAIDVNISWDLHCKVAMRVTQASFAA